jgi:uncharacterized membrane protein YcaP (DUF421 family)
MDLQSEKLSDWKRILIGNAPTEFLIEVLIRSIFIYAFLLVIVRILGKRMSGQLTITEMAVMLTLGAIISPPMQSPDRGILIGMMLLLFVLGFQRGFSLLTLKNRKIEQLALGNVTMLVKEGELQLSAMLYVNISREQLFAVLRTVEIYQLGKVKRVYQETNGDFSIYRQPDPKPGLSILPDGDSNLLQLQKAYAGEQQVCSRCGHLQSSIAEIVCSNCGDDHWEKAISEQENN